VNECPTYREVVGLYIHSIDEIDMPSTNETKATVHNVMFKYYNMQNVNQQLSIVYT